MEFLDYRELSFWWDLIQTAILAFVAIYTYLVNRTKANSSAIKNINKDMSSMNTRVSVLETKHQHAVTDDDIAKIHERINQMSTAIAKISGEFKQANRRLEMIHQYLLEKTNEQ